MIAQMPDAQIPDDGDSHCVRYGISEYGSAQQTLYASNHSQDLSTQNLYPFGLRCLDARSVQTFIGRHSFLRICINLPRFIDPINQEV